MKLKLDENLGKTPFELLKESGYNVCNVSMQNLQGADDDSLIKQVKQDERILVTLDLDFANPLRFPPHNYNGIAVLRLPSKASSKDLLNLTQTLSIALKESDISKHLWIVEKDRIRIFQND